MYSLLKFGPFENYFDNPFSAEPRLNGPVDAVLHESRDTGV